MDASSDSEAVVRRAIESWPSQLETDLFGTVRVGAIVEAVAGLCRDHLGRQLLRVRWYRRGVGAVFGLELEDDTLVVAKFHRPELVGRRLEGVVEVQRHLALDWKAVPTPVAGPATWGPALVTVETMVETSVANGHDPRVRAALVRGLHRFIRIAAPLVGQVQLNSMSPIGLPAGQRWPAPHDRRFDLEMPGGEWIDDHADSARNAFSDAAGDPAIGHLDWRLENVSVDADGVAGI